MPATNTATRPLSANIRPGTTRSVIRGKAYAALKQAGHCPAKALEIAIDAERGDTHAIAWMGALGIVLESVR